MNFILKKLRTGKRQGDDEIPEDLRLAWERDGLVLLPGIVTPEQVDRHVALVGKLRSEVPNGKDAYGLGDRIGQLHQKIPDLIDTVASNRLLSFAKYALKDDPLLFASLNFERGTQQEAHVDLIYFCTEPLHAMIGVWIALEDINENAGPLFYHLGSHNWPFEYADDIDEHLISSEKSISSDLLDARAKAWLNRLQERVRSQKSARAPMIIKKGDAVIWHARLAHGGMPRIDPGLSRRSVVYHFIGMNSRLYSYSDFFSYPKRELLKRPGVTVPVDRRGDVAYQRHAYFVTYHEGQEVVHNL
jgi:hypothetical protein